MAVTVTNNMTTIDNADSITGWALLGTGASSLTNETDLKIQGSASVGVKVTGGMTNDDIGGAVKTVTSFDATNEVFVIWVNTVANIFSKANGGVRLVLGDGTNQNFYFVAGSDTYTGGWQAFIVHGGVTADANSGTPATMTAITQVGAQIRTSSDVMGGIRTFWVDIMYRYADTVHAITVDGGLTGDRGNWAEVASDDLTNAYGIVQARGGAFLLQGRIKLGNDGSSDSFFQSRGEVVIWQDAPVENTQTTPTHYLDIVGGTGTNSVEFGEEIGSGSTSIGINGGTMKASNKSNAGFYLNIDQSDVTVLMAGMGIDGMNEFDAGHTNLTIVSCNINNCGIILLNDAEMRNCVISDSTSASGIGALEFITDEPATDDFRDNLFVNNVHALEWSINGANTLNLRKISFSNNTADIRFNHTTGLLTVNVLELGDTPTTSDGSGGGTIIIITAVSVVITVIDSETEVAIANARVGVEESISKIEIINALTNGSGVVQNTGYNLPADPTSVDIRVFDIDDAGQNAPRKRVEDITVNGLAITVRMPNNPQYTPTP